MRVSIPTLGLFTVLIAAGCSTTSGSAAAGAGTPLTLDTLNPAVIDAYCKSAGSCPTSFLWFASADSCKTLFGAKISGNEEIDWAKAGRMTFNADKAAECLGVIAGAGCVLGKAEPAACRDTFVGTVANGASCENDKVCVSRWCKGVNQKSATNTTGCGVCTEAIKVGEACKDNGCAAGSRCIGDKCVADGTVAVGAACSGKSSCVANAFCDFDDQGKQTCVKYAASGEACKDSSKCASGLTCLAKALSDKGGTCGAARKLGDPCFAIVKPGQGDGDCGPSLACGIVGEFDGKTEPKPVCVAQKKLAEACTSNWECGMLDAVCVAGKCGAWPAIGQPCLKSMGQTCAQNAMCGKDGNCAALPKLGEACTSQCAEGLGCKFAPGTNDGKCVGQPAAGDACTQDMDCGYSGLSCGADKKCAAMVCK